LDLSALPATSLIPVVTVTVMVLSAGIGADGAQTAVFDDATYVITPGSAEPFELTTIVLDVSVAGSTGSLNVICTFESESTRVAPIIGMVARTRGGVPSGIETCAVLDGSDTKPEAETDDTA